MMQTDITVCSRAPTSGQRENGLHGLAARARKIDGSMGIKILQYKE